MEEECESCIICYNNTTLKAMFESKFDNESNNCIDIFQSVFNLLFPKRNKFGKFYKLCFECFSKLRGCYEFKKQSELAYRRIHNRILHWNDNISNDLIGSSFGLIDQSNAENGFEKIKELEHSIPSVKEDPLDVTFLYEACDLDESIENEQIDQTKDKNEIANDKKSKCKFIKTATTLKKVAKFKKKKIKTIDSGEHTLDFKSDDIELSDCSTNTEEIFMATGFYAQQKVEKKLVMKPRLQKGTNVCPVCNKKFVNYNLTFKHYSVHFPIILCHLCGLSFSSYSGFHSHMLRLHVDTNDKKNKYICQPCNKVLRNKNTFRSHINLFHRNKKVKCYHCSESFLTSMARSKHMHEVHNVDCEFYYCNVCNKRFYSRCDLKRHTDQVHLKKTNVFCDRCFKGFYSKSLLIKHIQTLHREKEERKECMVCGRSLVSERGLKEHMKIHLNIKNYKCKDCPEAFVHKQSLDWHKKKHKTIQ